MRSQEADLDAYKKMRTRRCDPDPSLRCVHVRTSRTCACMCYCGMCMCPYTCCRRPMEASRVVQDLEKAVGTVKINVNAASTSASASARLVDAGGVDEERWKSSLEDDSAMLMTVDAAADVGMLTEELAPWSHTDGRWHLHVLP